MIKAAHSLNFTTTWLIANPYYPSFPKFKKISSFTFFWVKMIAWIFFWSIALVRSCLHHRQLASQTCSSLNLCLNWKSRRRFATGAHGRSSTLSCGLFKLFSFIGFKNSKLWVSQVSVASLQYLLQPFNPPPPSFISDASSPLLLMFLQQKETKL